MVVIVREGAVQFPCRGEIRFHNRVSAFVLAAFLVLSVDEK
jgi:hypothetical protein